MELNPSQLRAVSFGSGPCLVLAGPGSGKTTVIIRRLQNLISEYNVRPENILAVTFSRAAAGEMYQRFNAGGIRLQSSGDHGGGGNHGSGVTFGTVHSIFLKILRTDFRPDISVISAGEAAAFIKHELKRYSVPYQNADSTCREILLAISRSKTGSALAGASLKMPDQTFMKIFSDYSLFLKERSLFDFDDLISETARLFRSRPDVLAIWQEKFRYLNIDEFQDLSPLQYSTLMHLAGPSANVFAVGDDDQSIYGFRGAGGDCLKRFVGDHPGAARIVLDVNYRCRSDILSKAAAVIRENKERFEKNQTALQKGGTFTITAYNGRNEEYKEIISKIKELSQRGRECAVLFRSSYDYSLFVIMLRIEGIRFECREAAGSFSDQFPVRDVLSYLKSAAFLGAHSSAPCREDLLRIINRPERYIKRESMIGAGGAGVCSADTGGAGVCSSGAGGAESHSAKNCFDSMADFYRKDPKMLDTVHRLKRSLLMISALSPFAAVRYVRNVCGYDGWLLKYAEAKGLDKGECMESLELLESLAAEFGSLEELLAAVSLKDNDPAAGDDTSCAAKTGKISVMTMHASKGLEFDAVLLPDVNDGIIPCRSAVEEGTIDEERRLLYVAMTRARDELHISYVREYRYKPAKVSRLIRNLV